MAFRTDILDAQVERLVDPAQRLFQAQIDAVLDVLPAPVRTLAPPRAPAEKALEQVVQAAPPEVELVAGVHVDGGSAGARSRLTVRLPLFAEAVVL